jgi:predicted nucleic-acid-binding protein
MIAVDTNILVRFLVRDDAEQAFRANSLIRGNEIWISKTVLLETEWVLRSLYAFQSDSVARALQALAGLRSVSFEDEPGVAKAVDWFRRGLDFADALHLASAGNVDRFATFDRKLAKRAKQLITLKIVSI